MDKVSPFFLPVPASQSLFLFLILWLRGWGLWLVTGGRLACGLREAGQKLFCKHRYFAWMYAWCIMCTSGAHKGQKRTLAPQDWTIVIEGWEQTQGFWESNLEFGKVASALPYPATSPAPDLASLAPRDLIWGFLTSHRSCFRSFTNDFWSLSLILCGDLNDNWLP